MIPIVVKHFLNIRKTHKRICVHTHTHANTSATFCMKNNSLLPSFYFSFRYPNRRWNLGVILVNDGNFYLTMKKEFIVHKHTQSFGPVPFLWINTVKTPTLYQWREIWLDHKGNLWVKYLIKSLSWGLNRTAPKVLTEPPPIEEWVLVGFDSIIDSF